MHALVLMALLGGAATAADAGSRPAAAEPGATPAGALPADAGARPGAAATDAGSRAPPAAADAGASSMTPFFVIAEDTRVFDRFVTAKKAARATLGATTSVKIGRYYSGAVFVDGYTLPVSRLVDLSADLLVVDPNGRVVIERASFSRAKTMDPKTTVAVPLIPDVRFNLGLTDPEGVWKVKATVYDHVRGTSARLETTFTVAR